MAEQTGAKVRIQKIGAFLSGMVMPNIGAFVAWGLVTTLFLATGWIPNENLATLIGPTLSYLLPILIGYTGGKMVHGTRGAVIGTVATIGAVIGSEYTMLAGAMLMGPLSAWILKQFDKWAKSWTPAGFEMLVDNFSLGIIGAILMVFSYLVIGPIMSAIIAILSAGVTAITNAGLLPLLAIFVRPGQILFLNNAINHGILVPLATQQVAELGKSILFYVEADNGPLCGVLLAYMFFGTGISKQSAPASLIICMLGGIGEVQFPYVLQKPKLIAAPILGSMCSLFLLSVLGGGAVAAPSPGSLFAYIMVSPRESLPVNMICYVVGFAVSFAIASLLLRGDKEQDEANDAALAATLNAMTSGDMSAIVNAGTTAASTLAKSFADVRKICVCCDAGMGSSAMGEGVLRNKLNKAGLSYEVVHSSLSDIPSDADLIVTLKGLTDRAKASAPADAICFGVENFLGGTEFDALIEQLKG